MISQQEFSALSWLHGKLGLDTEINLYYLIGNLREGKYGLYYNCYEIDGRPIWQPKGELKVVQKAISEKLLPMFPRHCCCYGFSGGNCHQVAEKHLGYKSVLMFDLRHAFSQVSHLQVFFSLCGSREPRLSFYAARMVADLCTVGKIERVESHYTSFTSTGGILPQGASTSPRLFDLCMDPFDNFLSRLAQKNELTYNRYADNIFFSSKEGGISDRLRAHLLGRVGKQYRFHKVRQVNHGEMCRMLGLNLRTDSVANTREFKRGFRGALYHLEYALVRHLDYQRAWEIASGYAGFAIHSQLPDPLWQKFQELKQQIHNPSMDW